MKNILIAAALFGAACAGAPALAQTTININLGQPNFYGPLDLGGFAPPPVYSRQPIVVERQARYVGQPVYLRVPEGHRKHWNKHCRAYNACGQQVFFVQDGWYNNTYAPRYRKAHEGGYDKHAEKRMEKYDKQEEKRMEKYDKHEAKQDKHEGKGKDKDKGHGKHGD